MEIQIDRLTLLIITDQDQITRDLAELTELRKQQSAQGAAISTTEAMDTQTDAEYTQTDNMQTQTDFVSAGIYYLI